MSNLFVRGIAKTGTGTPTTLAYPANNTLGNLLVVAASGDGSTGCTVSDSQGNAWSKATEIVDASNGASAGIWYAPNCKAGANTVSVSEGSTTFMGVEIMEFSGPPTASPLDGVLTGSRTNASSTAPATATFTPSAGDLVVATVACSSAATITAGTGWLDGSSSSNHALLDSGYPVDAEYFLSAANTPGSATWTLSVAVATDVAYACFKTTAGATDPFPAGYVEPRRTMLTLITQ